MNNPEKNASIPRDSIVVAYVNGTLNQSARQQFEQKLKQDTDLQAEVEFEKTLRTSIKNARMPDEYTASDQFSALLGRIDIAEGTVITDENNKPESSNQGVVRRRNNVFSIAASFAAIGVVAALLILPTAQQMLNPSFTGLSSGEEPTIDLPSMVSESRIARLTLAEPLSSKAVDELLAGYQLQLVSQLPEQNALIVLAQAQVEPKMLNGWRNDTRIASAELVSLNAQKK